jgi:hypothetical protein
MWRFDRATEPVEQDNFWGKSPDQAAVDYGASVGQELGVAQVELAVDPYFPRTAKNVDPALAGKAAHRGGFTRLHLDSHVKWVKDSRLNP